MANKPGDYRIKKSVKKPVAKKTAVKPKTSAKPKPLNKASLKKDGTATPNQLARLNATGEAKFTSNTKVGTKDRFKKMKAAETEQGKIAKRMGIGDAQDADWYRWGVAKNNAKVKTAITKKRVTASRASDKMMNASKKTIAKKK